jgi:hypothetical protein
VSFILALILVSPALSEEMTDYEKRVFNNPWEDETGLSFEDDGFVEPTFFNLSKAYWALGKFDTSDDEAIDNFLMITECDLYQKYFFNDFEWASIHEATRASIVHNMSSYPTKFEILKPLNLDRYDPENQVFIIKEEDVMEGSRKFDVNKNNETQIICDHQHIIKDYPRNIVLILNRPINLRSFHVPPELAELYLEEARAYYEHMPHYLKTRKYEKIAYLRLKVSLFQYKETVRAMSGYDRAVVYGRLEGIEIYADYKKLKPLYVKEKNLLKRRKVMIAKII